MEFNVVIIGGGPAGIITALTAKSVNPEKSVCVIKEIGDGVIPCAIPYMMNTLADPKQNAMGDLPLNNAGIQVVVGKAVALDKAAHTVALESGESLSYERLVLATGTEAVMPPIAGVNKKGVFIIQKSMSAMTALREEVGKAKNIVIIGGGFIGAEFADELSKIPGKEIHVIEIMPKLLYAAFDDEFCDEVYQVLDSAAVRVHLSSGVVSIDGQEKAASVALEGGESIPADMVLVSIGARPSIDLAKTAGLRITDNMGG